MGLRMGTVLAITWYNPIFFLPLLSSRFWFQGGTFPVVLYMMSLGYEACLYSFTRDEKFQLK